MFVFTAATTYVPWWIYFISYNLYPLVDLMFQFWFNFLFPLTAICLCSQLSLSGLFY